MKLQTFGIVMRATVPAVSGRHGGRPYASAQAKFHLLIRLDTSGQRRRSYETKGLNSEPQNVEGWNRFRLRLRLRPDKSLSIFL